MTGPPSPSEGSSPGLAPDRPASTASATMPFSPSDIGSGTRAPAAAAAGAAPAVSSPTHLQPPQSPLSPTHLQPPQSPLSPTPARDSGIDRAPSTASSAGPAAPGSPGAPGAPAAPAGRAASSASQNPRLSTASTGASQNPRLSTASTGAAPARASLAGAPGAPGAPLSFRSSIASISSALGRNSSSATNRSSNRLSTATTASSASRTSSVNMPQRARPALGGGGSGSGSGSPSRSMSTVSEDSTRRGTETGAAVLPLSVPSKAEMLLSGFPYQQALFDLGVTPKQWEQFNDDIQVALNPSTLDKMAHKANKVPILPIGAFFLARYAMNVASRRGTEKRMVKALSEDVGGDKVDGLVAVFDRWNADAFNALGLDVTIQLSSSALSRAQKDDRKRKQKERKIREKYGTLGYYDDDAAASAKDSGGEKRYKLLVQRYDGPEPPPQYSQGDFSGSPVGEEGGVAMLDSTPAGPVTAEMEGSPGIAELPAEVGNMELNELEGEKPALAEKDDDSPRSPQSEGSGRQKPEIDPAMHQDSGFLPVELPG